MKKPTYKQIDATAKVVRTLNLAGITGLENLRTLCEEARAEYGEKSEAWQEGDTGQEEDARITQLENVVRDLDSAVDSLNEVSRCIEEIENDAPEGAFSR